ncbi:uncharacterized protein K452DRAFT_291095 [Aplosporella prunicola CBS 121167]|uniref:C2H2-type domain-containing protein n=1 Tax=Aplosporella prunicola CBS 121167 TaxID=1176127 RepID=A0A6A6B2L2_9PEZI|nr:uncharacterized protein K452DRAFT_291095 [Aplosporella prunicola CBS 121167]KAF2138056.1 hypothetical protein K452DRAFT_291095 [Aplosporella prunicola CBS 121167]
MTAQLLPAQAGTSLDFRKPLDAQVPLAAKPSAPTIDQRQEQREMTSPTADEGRGRRRLRDDEDAEEQDMDAEVEGVPGSSRKRRRSRKGLDKKFECPHEGCGKSYSRAEHLYRHQLNHNPKQIYHCDFPDCHRSFVRQDLCARHKERHSARGSQLLRKDTFMHNLNPIVSSAMANQNKDPKVSKAQASPPGQSVSDSALLAQSSAPSIASAGSQLSPLQDPIGSATTSSRGLPNIQPSNRSGNGDGWSRSNSVASGMPDAQARSTPAYGPPQRSASISAIGHSRSSYSPHSSHAHPEGFVPSALRSQSSSGAAGIQNTSTNSPFVPATTSAQGYSTSTAMSNQYATHSPAAYQSQSQKNVSQQFTPLSQSGFTSINQAQVFGGEGYSRSPFAMADDFTAWLFNDANFGPGQSPMGYPVGAMNNMPASQTFGLQAPLFGYDPTVNGYLNHSAPPHQPMAVNSILDTSLPETALSEEKRQLILDLIIGRFNETNNAPVKKQKEEFLDGNRDEDTHVLSLNMMQTYIGSYWVHFHTQLPLLHRPTFNAASCPELLLLSMMALGASCLEKSYGHEMTTTCSELANFLAWHLRWEIFMDADFRPPAKLWVFQALILLECFEKLYSTRPLHERAHIHHATTLTLMRRGSSLIGRSALDSPPSAKDGKSANGSTPANSQEEWWRQWITNEATRRAAFAAFVIDSIHATMFGHSAVMVAHEMRLPLPCDEALWSATSAQEVGRVEASLHSNGVKATTFLDGLKKTLSGQPVRTNSFGRTILMAGLLSVSWHMNQRDLQVSSLGASGALGGRDKWRGSLTRAFDFWKQDFDSSLAKNGELSAPTAYHYGNGVVDENVIESRTVLHHLAHMAMHVDIVDCQIFAGAPRLLGRSITPQDYAAAQRRMKEVWAPTARARDATFYALRFLSQVLMPGDNGTSSQIPAGASTGFDYSAREDYLLNRPWVLYFATLIVWSYGYALDGPIRPLYQLENREDMVKDMQGYLKRVGGARAPDALAKIPSRNACLGMLILLRDMFKKTRWELLHEASNLLGKCIEMLAPGAGF